MGIKLRLREIRQRLLVDLARAGDERAMRRLYNELYDPVYAFISSRVRSVEDREDLASTVFHKFLAGLGRYDGERGSVWTWIMTLARNAVIDHHRTRRQTDPLEPLVDTWASGEPDPLRELIENEEASFAHGIMQPYSPETQEMFSLRFARGFRYREIAEVMGLSEAAVKQRFSRTLRELQLKYETREGVKGGKGETWRMDRGAEGEA